MQITTIEEQIKLLEEYGYLTEYELDNDLVSLSTWSAMCDEVWLVDDFIDKYIKHLPFNKLVRGQTLSEKFIEKYKYALNLKHIFMYQRISEDLIEKLMKNKISSPLWIIISRWQKMSEDFIEKHKEDLHWSVLAQNEKLELSDEFIEKHEGKLKVNDEMKKLIEYNVYDSAMEGYYNAESNKFLALRELHEIWINIKETKPEKSEEADKVIKEIAKATDLLVQVELKNIKDFLENECPKEINK